MICSVVAFATMITDSPESVPMVRPETDRACGDDLRAESVKVFQLQNHSSDERFMQRTYEMADRSFKRNLLCSVRWEMAIDHSVDGGQKIVPARGSICTRWCREGGERLRDRELLPRKARACRS